MGKQQIMVVRLEAAPRLRYVKDDQAPVAQWIEHRSSKPMVAGSIPAGCASVSTLRNKDLRIQARIAPV